MAKQRWGAVTSDHWKDMSQNDSDEVTFQDAASFFSEEEWKHLQEWQKDLYTNVMKEIHQALISLGPLIAGTVCSIRAREKEELCSVNDEYTEKRHKIDHCSSLPIANNVCSIRAKEKAELRSTNDEYPERRHRINHCSSDVADNPEALFKIANQEPMQPINPPEPEGSQRNDRLTSGFPCFSSDVHLRKEEEPISIFIDHLGAEIKENCIDHNLGHKDVSFQIKDEGVTSCINHPDRRRIENNSSPLADGGIVNREFNVGDSTEVTGKAPTYKLPTGNVKLKELPSPEKEAAYHSHLWTDITHELGRDNPSRCESGFSNALHYGVYQDTQTSQTSDTYALGNNLLTLQTDLQQNSTVYSCPQCEKSFSKKEYLLKHRKIHIGVRPYQCTECGKSFKEKGNLVAHKRTHTGERPYQCLICRKSFNQKGVLNRHQRTHVGVGLFQCSECDNVFNQKGHFIAHQRTHTQNRVSS